MPPLLGRLAVSILAVALAAAPALADEKIFVLKSGRKMQGDLVSEDAAGYTIKLAGGGTTVLSKSMVVRVEDVPPELRQPKTEPSPVKPAGGGEAKSQPVEKDAPRGWEGASRVDVAALLAARRFDEAEAELRKIHDAGRREGEAVSGLVRVLWDLAQAHATLRAAADEWCEKSPGSYLAFLVRGDLRIADAWDVRPTDKADDARRELQLRLERAKKDLEESLKLNGKSGHAAALLITVASGLHLPEAELDAYFKKAEDADPKCETDAWERRLEALSWPLGSSVPVAGPSEPLFAFARAAVKKHPDEPRLALVVLQAHRIASERPAWKYWSDPLVAKEAREACGRVLARYPRSPGALEVLTRLDLAAGDTAATAKSRERLAELGESERICRIADMLWNAQKRDAPEAVKWYQAAAKLHHAPALSALGDAYADGVGIAEDKAAAFKCYKEAADAGHAPGQTGVALCYMLGEGVTQNEYEGLRYFKLGAEGGNARAQFHLGRIYLDGTALSDTRLVEPDATEAKKWLTKAAAQGDAQAKAALAQLK